MHPSPRQKTEEYLLYLEALDEVPGRLQAYHDWRAELDILAEETLLAVRTAQPPKITATLKCWNARHARAQA